MRKRDMERALEMARNEVAVRPYAMGGAVALGLLCLYASGESDLPDDPLEFVTEVLRISVDIDRESAAGEVE